MASRVLMAVLFGAFVTGGAGPAAADSARGGGSTTVTVPGGTPVNVHLVGELSSRDVHAGDKFAFVVQEDVREGGWLVIASGAQGVGEIDTVEEAGSNGHAGKLGMKFDYVYAVDGEKIRLSDVDNHDAGDDKKGAASTATIASYALLGPLGFFAHNFVKGRDATIPPTKILTVFVDETVHVAGTQKSANDDDFAH